MKANALVATEPLPARNPGPSWGYAFLQWTDRVVPEFIFRPLRALGTAIAMMGMHAQRRESQAYLRIVLNRAPTLRDVFRHFFSFEESLMLRLRVANGLAYPCVIGEESEAVIAWLATPEPIILGTFHIGVSDLLGFQLGNYRGRRVFLVRQKVGNSQDIETLAARFGESLRFIWINEPSEMLFALKEAAQTDGAIALQCDRVEFCSRTESFEFLGERRVFPFTVYHLALIFGRAVILTVGVPSSGRAVLYGSPRFDPLPGESRDESLARARIHFQDFLSRMETLLRKNPYLWFNFIPLNPPAESLASSQ